MPSRLEPLHLRADVCGLLAHRFLHEGKHGRVAAVFEKTFYVRSGDKVACVGSAALPSSPINVATDMCRNTDWRNNGLRVGVPWRVSDSAIVFGCNLSVRLEDAHVWQPVQLAYRRCNRELNKVTTAFYRELNGRVPNNGLGMLIAQPGPPAGAQLLEMAAEPVEQLRRWLAKTGCEDGSVSSKTLQSVRPLLGLGPGLTPSGDDFLAGIMITLHAFGHEDSVNELWQTIRPWALQTGNFISFAHLVSASKGMGFAPIHDFLNALHQGDVMEMMEQLNAIDYIGHTSGWDTLAGVLTAVDVLKDKM